MYIAVTKAFSVLYPMPVTRQVNEKRESGGCWVGVTCESVGRCDMGLLLGETVSSSSNLAVANHSWMRIESTFNPH